MTPKQVMLRAAQLLIEDANALEDSHTLNGKWVILDEADKAAQADHDERILLAKQLTVMARVG